MLFSEAYHLCRITTHDGIVGDIVGYDGACTDNAMRPYAFTAGEDNCPRANPYITGYHQRLGRDILSFSDELVRVSEGVCPPLNKHILTHKQAVIHNQFAAMQAEILANTHIISYTDGLSIADIGSLLYIDRLATFNEKMFRTTITQAVGNLSDDGKC